MDDLQRVLQHLSEVEVVLKQYDYPGANPAALSRIEMLVTHMRGVDSYISEKAGQLKELAAVFYSARRHQKYPGGPERLHAVLLFDLPERIRGQAEHLLRQTPDLP